MLKRLQCIGVILSWQAGLTFLVMVLGAYQAGQTEHTRMNDAYTETLYDKAIEGAIWLLCAPVLLLNKLAPSFERYISQSWLIFFLNAFLTGSLLFGVMALLDKIKARD